MTFQDNTDTQTQIPREPGVAARWLRRIFVDDLNLKLLALAITLVLWFAVTGRKQPMTTRLAGVQLSFVHADDMQISNDPPEKIDVTLTGNADKLAAINPVNLIATVTLTDHATGDRVVRLARDRVGINLPDGVQIESFQPATVLVRMEPKVNRAVDVELKFEGKVPDGYEISAASASPAKVNVSGPASHANRVEKAPTESISLDGRKSSFDLSGVAINITDQKIDVLPGAVNVHVDISERAVEKSFNGVQVSGPNGAPTRVVEVILSGSPTVLAQLRVEEIHLIEAGSSGHNDGLRLELPAAIQDKIKLVSFKPKPPSR